jgi:GntR family transcriptional regulator, transcriptional repressor for pyruvate dehydrogenase complex
MRHVREGAADVVVRGVQQRIRAGALEPGHRIGTKTDLGREYGVAPATLGEALRVLRARGVVDVRPGPGGGVFVAAPSPLLALAQRVLELREEGASVNDVAAVLDGLDEVVVRDAATHRTPADLADLDGLVARLVQAWTDPARRPAAMWALHGRIAEISPNLVLRAFYTHLVAYLGDALEEPDVVDGFDPASPERLRAHLELVEAIRTRDPADLDRAVRRHRDSSDAA